MVQWFEIKIFTSYAEVPGSIPGRCNSTCSTVVVAQHLYDSFLLLDTVILLSVVLAVLFMLKFADVFITT